MDSTKQVLPVIATNAHTKYLKGKYRAIWWCVEMVELRQWFALKSWHQTMTPIQETRQSQHLVQAKGLLIFETGHEGTSLNN